MTDFRPATIHNIKLGAGQCLALPGYKLGIAVQNRERKVGDAWEGSPDDDRIFTNDVGRPLFPTSLTQWMGKFIKRTGLPPSSVHSLRHTYASLLIADGTPLVVVSGNLGHAQVSTTNDIYSHVIASAEAKAAEVMDRFSDDIHPKFTPKPKKQEIS